MPVSWPATLKTEPEHPKPSLRVRSGPQYNLPTTQRTDMCQNNQTGARRDETNLSAEAHPAKAGARLPKANEYPRWAQRASPTAAPWTYATDSRVRPDGESRAHMRRGQRLRRPADFQ